MEEPKPRIGRIVVFVILSVAAAVALARYFHVAGHRYVSEMHDIRKALVAAAPDGKLPADREAEFQSKMDAVQTKLEGFNDQERARFHLLRAAWELRSAKGSGDRCVQDYARALELDPKVGSDTQIRKDLEGLKKERPDLKRVDEILKRLP